MLRNGQAAVAYPSAAGTYIHKLPRSSGPGTYTRGHRRFGTVAHNAESIRLLPPGKSYSPLLRKHCEGSLTLGRAGVGEKSRARTRSTSQGFRRDRHAKLLNRQWRQERLLANSFQKGVRCRLQSSPRRNPCSVIDPRHPYALTRLSKRVRESGPNVLADIIVEEQQDGGIVDHVM